MSTLFDAGLAVRRQVLGDAHVDRSMTNVDPLATPLQDLVTRFAWGGVWSRPELPRKTRSLLTIALLTAGSHHDELRVHVRGAVRNGCTPVEITETITHVSAYCGMPAALSAMRVAMSVLAEAAAIHDDTAVDPT
jgi:4-carboxymuconolactone decarboxylase